MASCSSVTTLMPGLAARLENLNVTQVTLPRTSILYLRSYLSLAIFILHSCVSCRWWLTCNRLGMSISFGMKRTSGVITLSGVELAYSAIIGMRLALPLHALLLYALTCWYMAPLTRQLWGSTCFFRWRLEGWQSFAVFWLLVLLHVDVRVNTVMTNDDDDDNTDDNDFPDSLWEILCAPFMAKPALDPDLAVGAVNSNVDFDRNSLLSPFSPFPFSLDSPLSPLPSPLLFLLLLLGSPHDIQEFLLSWYLFVLLLAVWSCNFLFIKTLSLPSTPDCCTGVYELWVKRARHSGLSSLCSAHSTSPYPIFAPPYTILPLQSLPHTFLPTHLHYLTLFPLHICPALHFSTYMFVVSPFSLYTHLSVTFVGFIKSLGSDEFWVYSTSRNKIVNY